MIRRMFIGIQFWEVPACQVCMYTIHECSIISHFRRQGCEEVSYAMFLFNINIKVANHYKVPHLIDIESFG